MQIKPHSITCLATIMKSKHKVVALPMCHTYTNWIWKLEDGFRACFVWGGSGLGKSHWALSHFANPKFVRHMDDLKTFDPEENDGIVFDDMQYHEWSSSVWIFLTDWDLPCTINVKHGAVAIPAHTRKIFCSNPSFEDSYTGKYENYLAVLRRLQIIHVTDKLFA